MRTLALVALLLPLAATTARATSVFGGRVPCTDVSGVQFCAGDVTRRVESFDGVPLDANVTLPPASMTRPFPLIVDLHGWGADKNPAPYLDWASRGFVVLAYAARGFHASCGSLASRAPDPTLTDPTACATRGWIRLADLRYEIHDTQYLAGLLVDEGLVDAARIGVTGASYGGGQSMMLAALRDRTMLSDGTLVPWTSPGGRPMTIAAAAPLIPWSDLSESLVPAGRTLDFRADNPYRRAGVQKKSFLEILYATGATAGYYVPPGVDFDSDIPAWNARISAGEPYDGDSAVAAITDQISTRHSAYYVDDSVQPAPLFIYNAWTDDLFPVEEALRFANKTKARYPNAQIGLLFADSFGHPRAALAYSGAMVTEKVTAFFEHQLHGTGAAPPAIETFTQACNGATVAGPYTADDWDAIHPGEVRFVDAHTRRFTSAGGTSANAAATDPFAGGPCRTVSATDDPGAATYLLPRVRGRGYTLLGAPTVIAHIAATSGAAQIAARLWDVGPDGMQTLVAQSLHRPRTDNRGPQVFQIHANGWHFAARHRPKLELLGQSAPYGRPSNVPFTVTVGALALRLPVHEAPHGKQVLAAWPHPAPVTESEPIGCPLAPRMGCIAAHRSTLQLRITPRADDALLKWNWALGIGVTFPDPTTSTGYAVCLYDVSGAPIAGAIGAAGSSWRSSFSDDGYDYRDRLADTGLYRMKLENFAGLASGRAGARGSHLGVPATTALALPVTAQIVADDGTCITSSFSTATESAHEFRARGD